MFAKKKYKVYGTNSNTGGQVITEVKAYSTDNAIDIANKENENPDVTFYDAKRTGGCNCGS